MHLTEQLIQRLIMHRIYNTSFVLPNHTPHPWNECDVFQITSSGYFREYEIKLTLSDFKHDRTKKCYGSTKHTLLSQGSPLGPNQFYFVTPPGLLFPTPQPQGNPAAVLPQWAGLFEVVTAHGWVGLNEVVRAPRLHKHKFDERRLERAKRLPYWRMHRLLKTHCKVRDEDND
jgi:hypothetical protein